MLHKNFLKISKNKKVIKNLNSDRDIWDTKVYIASCCLCNDLLLFILDALFNEITEAYYFECHFKIIIKFLNLSK